MNTQNSTYKRTKYARQNLLTYIYVIDAHWLHTCNTGTYMGSATISCNVMYLMPWFPDPSMGFGMSRREGNERSRKITSTLLLTGAYKHHFVVLRYIPHSGNYWWSFLFWRNHCDLSMFKLVFNNYTIREIFGGENFGEPYR